MGQIIFKKIDRSMQVVKEKIRVSVDKEEQQALRTQLLALRRVDEYVDSLEWLAREDAKTRIQVVRAANFDYEVASEELKETIGSLKVFVSYCNKRLEEKVGENTIDLIMAGRVKEGVVQFESLRGTYTRKSLMLCEVQEKLPKPEFKPIALKTCTKELQFLHKYSTAEMEREYAGLDKRKLLFLMYILEANTPKHSKDKYEMVKMLTGNCSIEEYLYEIEAKEL